MQTVTIPEPMLVELVQIEVVRAAPSGEPADMELGRAAAHDPAVLAAWRREVEHLDTSSELDAVVAAARVDELRQLLEDAALPSQWATVLVVPVDPPQRLTAGRWAVEIVDVDVEVEPARTVEVANPDYRPPVVPPPIDYQAELEHLRLLADFEEARTAALAAGHETPVPAPTSPNAAALEVKADPGTPDLPPTITETIPAVVATRQRARLTEVDHGE